MYKSRLGIWGGAVSVIVCIILCIKLFTWIGTDTSQTYNLYCHTPDNVLKTAITNVGGDYRFNLYDSKEDAEIIIQPSSDEVIAGYSKYSNYVYTPLVLFARSTCLNNDSGFTVLNGNSSNSTAYKDLLIILEAMEEGKTYEDIGINKKTATGEVKLAIPSKTSVYYSYVEELFYVTLNNGEIPTEAEKTSLKTRVDDLLKECIKVEDIGAKIIELYEKDSKEYTLFIGPECIITRNKYAFNTTNDDAWCSVYLNYTVPYSYDLFVKTDNKETLLNAFSKGKFSSVTGYRVYNTDNIASTYNHTISNITFAK